MIEQVIAYYHSLNPVEVIYHAIIMVTAFLWLWENVLLILNNFESKWYTPLFRSLSNGSAGQLSYCSGFWLNLLIYGVIAFIGPIVLLGVIVGLSFIYGALASLSNLVTGEGFIEVVPTAITWVGITVGTLGFTFLAYKLTPKKAKRGVVTFVKYLKNKTCPVIK